MDFSKAFDNVKHDILCDKLKRWPGINPNIINWYISFLENRKQRVVINGHSCEWKKVNKGTIQGSVSGPYLFNIFLNDLNMDDCRNTSLSKYADDSNILVTVNKNDSCEYASKSVDHFMQWTIDNGMSSNKSKCKELVFSKKNDEFDYQPIFDVKQTDHLTVLGVTLQANCKFTKHVSNKLAQANKCLHVLRTLRQEKCSQKEMDLLFDAIVLPKISYGLSVIGSSSPDLNSLQQFLDRCYKRNFTSKHYNIYELLEKSDMNIFKAMNFSSDHPLKDLQPRQKPDFYSLRNPGCIKPLVNTERFKNSFINRIIFKYNL